MKHARSLGPFPAALLSVLLAGFFTSFSSTPATAQTILLQIDYKNSVRFHVLSDGRVLLPLGAAAGYVLTSDSDGYGIWRALPGGGLSSVSSDATLTGDGTAGDPLGVSVPLFLTGNSVDGQVRGEHAIGHFGYLGDEDYGVYGEYAFGNFGYLGSQFYGAYGLAEGGFSWGVLGDHANGNFGYLGGSANGAYGQHTNDNFGYFGSSDYGAYGQHNNDNFGYFGSSDYGAYGQYTNDNYGLLGSNFSGVYGFHNNGNFGRLGSTFSGAYGEHHDGNYGYVGGLSYGAYGYHNNGNVGHLGTFNSGAAGTHNNGNFGRLGHEDYGVYGEYGFDNFGYLGSASHGVYGEHDNGNVGHLGSGSYGVFGYAGVLGTHAGYFIGNVEVTGSLIGGSAAFKVDHPLDPENQYLVHSSVESPDMKNVYDGNVTTDARGEAVVELPDYFEVLNRDFRYQLTAIGGFAPLYIAEKISGNRFKIAGGTPGMEVSWQVTGIRQDRWANENRIVVEQDKPAIERGFYLHPKLYGQPEERSIEWARDPEGMRTMKERPARMEAERQQMEEEHRQIAQERQRMQAERQRMKTERQRMQQQQRPPRPRPDNQP